MVNEKNYGIVGLCKKNNHSTFLQHLRTKLQDKNFCKETGWDSEKLKRIEKLHQWFATTKSYAYQSKPDLLKEQLSEAKLPESYKLKDIINMSYYVDDKGLLNACITSPANITGLKQSKNYECFELLLNTPGLDVDYIDATGKSCWDSLFTQTKTHMVDRLFEKKNLD